MLDISARLSTALAGRYVIERELGAGGMATVYLAKELKHEREVALKVLRPEIAAQLGAERFLNEVKITARLDHPHILTLIDSGESDGFLWYAQPYVRGESLRGRLHRDKQLGIDEAIVIARQVASALQHAHTHGVIHRDIKPENILLHEGEAMVADFGIALALAEAADSRLTATGMSLGTPQYMSPEQATGERELDARSDVYSLAAVLYEMLAGVPPHTGATSQAIIAKLLTERPTRLRAIRASVPPEVEATVVRALEKTPADRPHSAAEFSTSLRASEPRLEPLRRPALVPLLIVAGVIAVALVGALLLRRAPAVAIGRSEQLTAEPGLEIQPALSPDGRLVAYAAGTVTQMRIFIRPVGDGRTIPLSDDSSAVETQPRWSPDGTKLLYLTRGGAAAAPAFGGLSQPLVPPSTTGVVQSAIWSPDGRAIAFVRADSLLSMPLGGGGASIAPRLIGRAVDLHSCNWSPNGKWIACVTQNSQSTWPGGTFGNIAPSAILSFPAGGGEPVRVAEARWFNQSPVFAPDSRQLLFLSSRDGPRDVYALTLSSSGRPRGEPRRISTGLGATSISISADGRRIAYGVYSAHANIWSLPIPRTGVIGTAGATPVTRGNQVIEGMRTSRDGHWLLYDSDLRGNADIYRVSLLGGGEIEQLTSEPYDEFAPALSPDGSELAYHSWRTGTRDIEVKPLNGGPVVHVTDSPAHESYPSWSPDGRSLAFYDQIQPLTVLVVHRDADGKWGKPIRLSESGPSVMGKGTSGHRPEWSPDGRWLAFVSTSVDARAGRIAIVPAAGGTARYLDISTGPLAGHVYWSPDGRALYYKAHDAQGRTSFWSISAQGGASRLLVRFDDPGWQSARNDFATDGKRFYFAVEDRQSDVFTADLINRP